MNDDFDDPNEGFLTALWTAGITKARPYRKKLTVLLGVAMLVILAGVLWVSARHAHHHKNDVVMADGVPVVQAPATPWRVKPTDPGGMEIPYRDSTVFNALQPPAGAKAETPPDVSPTVKGSDKVENLLAPPTQLVPKSKLFPEVKAEAPAATAPPTSIVGGEETADAPSADADEFVPENNETPAKTAPATASTTAKPGYYVQLGAVVSTAAAQASWSRAQKTYTELSGLPLHVEPVAKGSATLYRVQAGPVEQAQAKALCAAVTAKKPGGCIVVKH